MTNPIPTSNMWVTCPTMGELMERLAGLTSNPRELSLIMHGAMLALNTAHYLVEAELKETV